MQLEGGEWDMYSAVRMASLLFVDDVGLQSIQFHPTIYYLKPIL